MATHLGCSHWLTVLSFLCSVIGKELYSLRGDYNRNIPPGDKMNVSISLFINRVSAVDENKEEISLEVFLQVYWEDNRIEVIDDTGHLDHLELTWEKEQQFWVPDLYIRQLREMKVLSLFQEMTSVRLYKNHTMRVSIGATVILKCDMDFELYPLDVQTCTVDFSSYKYTMLYMNFTWRDDPALSFPSDFTGESYRLPKYVVSFTIENDMHFIYYGEGNHSTARMTITLSREIRSHLLETYLPSSLFVIMSWGSFVVIPEVVPGRMVLLVTTLLSLVTMFDTVRNNSPSSLELKCIEVWLISCTMFVFFALIEYFIVLFGIRYDKHWRHKKKDFEKINIMENHASLPPKLEGLRLFGTNKIQPIEAESKHNIPISRSDIQGTDDTEGAELKHPKLQGVAQYIILYCGSQRGMLDQVSLCLFPLCFLIFAIVYWVSYINASNQQFYL
uniref:Neurotransmitter-gated ion-channel ligand-binding domain-containing protein n=1 Tax=Clastoptera arizonana TaxID=38151 RepID=A0A1B6E4Y7_9HEMI